MSKLARTVGHRPGLITLGAPGCRKCVLPYSVLSYLAQRMNVHRDKHVGTIPRKQDALRKLWHITGQASVSQIPTQVSHSCLMRPIITWLEPTFTRAHRRNPGLGNVGAGTAGGTKHQGQGFLPQDSSGRQTMGTAKAWKQQFSRWATATSPHSLQPPKHTQNSGFI